MADALTPLCELAIKYGSDKCPKYGHSYTPWYHQKFEPIRNEPLKILEIGIGNHELMAPIVGEDYKPGASLRMWAEYFPNAQITGLDIREDVLFQEGRIATFLFDQSCPKSLEMLENSGFEFDIIIDDGSHDLGDMMLTQHFLWDVADKYYIIEDVRTEYLPLFKAMHPYFKVRSGMNNWDNLCYLEKHGGGWNG